MEGLFGGLCGEKGGWGKNEQRGNEAGAASSQVRRDITRRFTFPEVIQERLAPGNRATDPGAVSPTLQRLYFYRVRGTNCAGDAGP